MKLYSDFAKIYDEEYLRTFDYNSMFKIMEGILEEENISNKANIIELGCGTGHLAKILINRGYSYTGIDLSPAMIEIAESNIDLKEVLSDTHFIVSDMRKLDNIDNSKFDIAVSLGRSFAHLNTNTDIISTLNSVNKVLKAGGLLIFDNFDAREIFSNFKERTAKDLETGNKIISRWSNNEMMLDKGWIWKWNFHYTIKYKQTNMIESFHDSILLRAFTPDELELFLKLTGFDKLEKDNKELGPESLLTVAKKADNIANFE